MDKLQKLYILLKVEYNEMETELATAIFYCNERRLSRDKKIVISLHCFIVWSESESTYIKMTQRFDWHWCKDDKRSRGVGR